MNDPLFSPLELLANQPVKLDEEMERQTTAGSGRTLLQSSEPRNHAGASLKMLADYLLSSKVWYSKSCSLRWKIKVTRGNVSLYQLSPSVRRTEEIGSGLWLATPTATDAQEGMRKSTQQKEGSRHSITLRDDIARIATMLPSPTSSDATTGSIIGKNDTFRQTKGLPRKVNQNGKDGSVGLGRLMQMLPTPVVKPTEDVVIVPVAIKDGMTVPAMLPTPCQRDWKGEVGASRQSKGVADVVQGQAGAGTKTGLKLQPAFVEWMMGYEQDWTNVLKGKIMEKWTEIT